MPDSAAKVLRGWQAASSRLLSTASRLQGRQRTCVAEYGNSRLWFYPTDSSSCPGEPVVMVYAMVNRPTVLDLLPERSFIDQFLQAGRSVYLLEWCEPDFAGYNQGIDHYVGRRMDALLQGVRRHSGQDKLTLMGVCQGGVLSLLYALHKPQELQALVLSVTPIDFQTPGCVLYQRVREVDTSLLKDSWCLDGDLLVQLFHSLQPMRNTIAKYLQLAEDCADGESIDEKVRLFRAMESWIADCPDQPAAFFQEFIRVFYQQNRLMSGQVELCGRDLKLQDLAVPVLNIYGQRDHIVPEASSRALSRLVAPALYDELPVDVGHIGMFVSTRSLRQVPDQVCQWLDALN